MKREGGVVPEDRRKYDFNSWSLHSGEATPGFLGKAVVTNLWLTMRPCPKCKLLLSASKKKFICQRCGYEEEKK